MNIDRVKVSVKEDFRKHLCIYRQIQNMNQCKNIKEMKKTFYPTWKKINSLMYGIHKDLILRKSSHTFILDFPINLHLSLEQTTFPSRPSLAFSILSVIA